MSVEFLNVILLVEDSGHVGVGAGHTGGGDSGGLLVPAHADGVAGLPLGAQVQREVDHALLAVQVLLLANTVMCFYTE